MRERVSGFTFTADYVRLLCVRTVRGNAPEPDTCSKNGSRKAFVVSSGVELPAVKGGSYIMITCVSLLKMCSASEVCVDC